MFEETNSDPKYLYPRCNRYQLGDEYYSVIPTVDNTGLVIYYPRLGSCEVARKADLRLTDLLGDKWTKVILFHRQGRKVKFPRKIPEWYREDVPNQEVAKRMSVSFEFRDVVEKFCEDKYYNFSLHGYYELMFDTTFDFITVDISHFKEILKSLPGRRRGAYRPQNDDDFDVEDPSEESDSDGEVDADGNHRSVQGIGGDGTEYFFDIDLEEDYRHIFRGTYYLEEEERHERMLKCTLACAFRHTV